MKSIWADFNARTEDDRVRLDAAGSKKSLVEARATVGEYALLTDGEVCVVGMIEDRDGQLVARVDWSTKTEVQ